MTTSRQQLRRQLLHASSRLVRQPALQPWRPQRLLLLRPDHLGDILWLTPALHALRQQLPAATITVAVGPWGKAVLDAHPDLDELLIIPFPGFTRTAKAGLLAPYQLLRSTARSLRQQQFDTALILRDDHWWGALLAAQAGIPRRFGFAQPDVQPFLTDTLPQAPHEHAALDNLRLVDAVVQAAGQGSFLTTSADPEQFPLVFHPDQAAQERAGEQLAPCDPSRPIVAIHSSAGVPVKLWPEQRLAAVADALVGRHNAQIILTGGPDDWPLTTAVTKAMQTGAPLNLTGQTTIAELVALYRRCALVIGPDCGALHLAVAAGTPSIHLFGPADFRRFGPWGAAWKHQVVHAGMHCSHCSDLSPERPRGAACMLAISVDQVLAAAAATLASAVQR